jgi:hypothetical protein
MVEPHWTAGSIMVVPASDQSIAREGLTIFHHAGCGIPVPATERSYSVVILPSKIKILMVSAFAPVEVGVSVTEKIFAPTLRLPLTSVEVNSGSTFECDVIEYEPPLMEIANDRVEPVPT